LECREAEEILPSYALDALEPEEAALLEAHPDTCPWCPTLLQEHVQVATDLAEAAEQLRPPQSLKDRTLKAVSGRAEHPQRHREPLFSGARVFAAGAVASASVFFLGAVVVLRVILSNKIDDLQDENVLLATRVSLQGRDEEKLMDMAMEQRSISYIMASSDNQVLALQGTSSIPQSQGMLLISSQGSNGILMAKGLEPTSGDTAYHVWLGQNGSRITVGRLIVDDTGWGMLTFWNEQPITLFQQVWVTEDSDAATASIADSPILWGDINNPGAFHQH